MGSTTCLGKGWNEPDSTPKLTAEQEAIDYADKLGVPVCQLAWINALAKTEATRQAFEEAAERLDDECVTNEHEGREQAAAEDSRMAEVFRALAKEQGK